MCSLKPGLCPCPFAKGKTIVICGSDAVENETCFVTPFQPRIKDPIEITLTQTDFKIELVCCGLIVVCGIIHKDIFKFGNDTSVADQKRDIPVQLKIPVNVNLPIVDKNKLTIDAVELCDGCYKFMCEEVDSTGKVTGTYHKLVEKDIIAVQITYTQP